MVITFIESIGAQTIRFIFSLYKAISFFILCIFYLFNPKNYNSQIVQNFVSLFYYTSITSMGFFTFLAFLFGSVIMGVLISFAVKYNLQVHIGPIIITFLFNEFAAFFTVFFVYYRVMPLLKSQNLSSETTADIILPQLLNASLSTLVLSILFAIIMISSGLIISSFIMGLDFYTYESLIFDAIEIKNIVTLIIKSLLFGFVSIVALIYNTIRGTRASIAWLLMSLFLIEILALVVESI